MSVQVLSAQQPCASLADLKLAKTTITSSIVVPEGSPFMHGASVWKGYIYWVDDIGGGNAPVCRCRI